MPIINASQTIYINAPFFSHLLSKLFPFPNCSPYQSLQKTVKQVVQSQWERSQANIQLNNLLNHIGLQRKNSIYFMFLLLHSSNSNFKKTSYEKCISVQKHKYLLFSFPGFADLKKETTLQLYAISNMSLY